MTRKDFSNRGIKFFWNPNRCLWRFLVCSGSYVFYSRMSSFSRLFLYVNVSQTTQRFGKLKDPSVNKYFNPLVKICFWNVNLLGTVVTIETNILNLSIHKNKTHFIQFHSYSLQENKFKRVLYTVCCTLLGIHALQEILWDSNTNPLEPLARQYPCWQYH